jgi:hypothetical protein
MGILRVVLGLFLLSVCIGSEAQTPVNEVSGTGKLTRMMAVGGESTGWEIQFDSPTAIEGKEISSIQVRFADPKQAQKNENKHVQVTGSVVHRHGPETGEVLILDVTTIKSAKSAK